MRAVVDTNVLVAGLIRPRGAPGEVLRRLRDAHFVAIVSRPLLEKLEAVLARPWLREKYEVHDRDVEALLRLLVLRAELVTPTVPIRRCRDPHDDSFLEAAVAGAADRIVSGDADLLSLDRHAGIAIVTPAAFVAELD